MLLLFVVALFLIVAEHLFIHGLHEGLHYDAFMNRLFIWFWGWDGRTWCRQRSLW